MRGATIDWLLDGPAWVEYRTRLDLLEEGEDSAAVRQARAAMLAAPEVVALVEALQKWPGPVLKSHKSAGHLLHKLVFVAELGLDTEDPGMPEVIRKIQAHQSPEGPYQVLVNISPKYGGSGEDQYVWMLCDAPLVLYALTVLGVGQVAPENEAVSHLVGLVRDNGWPCAVAPVLGKFRGPGRKSDPCPYANLLMLKLLAQSGKYRDSREAKIGVETLLTLWEQRKERRPYLFAMGSGFEKLKAPRIWYDVVHVTDVLSQFEWARADPRFQEMVTIVQSKADDEGRFTPESVWRDWKGWDFGQKRAPSRWLTLVVSRMLKRVGA